MVYGLYANGILEVGISIWNKLVLPIVVEDLDIMMLNTFSSKEESLSLVSCRTGMSIVLQLEA